MQRKNLFALSLAAAAVLLAGCDWTSSSGDSSWSGSYDEMNFGGTYRITSITQTGTSDSSDTQPVQTKSFGSTAARKYTYSGSIGAAVIPGSASIIVSGIGQFVDLNSNGTLVGDGINGTANVTYNTGDWSFTLDSNPGDGHAISVQYQASPVSSGSTIVSYTGIDTTSFDKTKVSAITVSQTGQHLSMHFNNGATMSGRFTSVRQTGKVSEDTGAGANTYNAQFEVSGANGKMVGTLNYDYPSHNRYMDGTLTYGRNTFDVHAIGPAWTESGVTTVNEASN